MLVDELDRGWDGSEDAKAFVSGLFSATTSINARHEGVRVVISLRRELYDNIPEIYEDYQKISDTVEIISWSEDTLREFVGRRVARMFPELEPLDFEARWNAIFSETLSYRKTKSYNYIIDRTLFRPRELIQFANAIADKAKANKRTLPLDYDTIVAAEGAYSESRMKDIASEYRTQYPGLLFLFESFRGLKFNMTKVEFQQHLLGVACGEFELSKDAEWMKSQEPEGLIRILWEVGFIKAQVVGGVKAQRRSGSTWLGSYQISGINVTDMPQYQVHPMFRNFLGMKEGKSKAED